MILGGIQKTTLIDFPGRVAVTVFLKGCNFRCPFCYSSSLVLPEKAGESIARKDFFSFLEKNKGLLEGVVICGGEPTIHQDLPEFALKIKEMGYLVKVDTNGSNPRALDLLIKKGLVDYIAMDVKAPLEKYSKAAGVEVEKDKIKESISLIKSSSLEYEFRTTVVPGLHTKEDILQIARDIAPASKYFLQSFKPGDTLDQGFANTAPFPEDFLMNIKEEIKRGFEICGLRG